MNHFNPDMRSLNSHLALNLQMELLCEASAQDCMSDKLKAASKSSLETSCAAEDRFDTCQNYSIVEEQAVKSALNPEKTNDSCVTELLDLMEGSLHGFVVYPSKAGQEAKSPLEVTLCILEETIAQLSICVTIGTPMEIQFKVFLVVEYLFSDHMHPTEPEKTVRKKIDK